MGPGTCVVRKGFMEVKGQKRKKSDAEGLRPGKQRKETQRVGCQEKEPSSYCFLAPMGGV